MPRHWTTNDVLELARSFQPACILAAAADLDLFTKLTKGSRTAPALCAAAGLDERALTILLDALAALGLLNKSNEEYVLAEGVEETLTATGSRSVLAMAQHQANCLRAWAALAQVVHTGSPAPRGASVRGAEADREAFIGAMHNVSAPAADEVVRAIQPLQFRHLLDVGGASGTWTMALLRACPDARATLVDLAPVIPLARERLTSSGMAGRVTLVAADFLADPLPAGADLAWVSAIAHQNSREENRHLFRKIIGALAPGGRIALRDIVMEPSRIAPPAGALFAVNMLVNTAGGGTYSLAEYEADLASAGFERIEQVRRDSAMNSVLVARKPCSPA